MKLINNEYKIQNISLLSLARQYGTPLYIYDAEVISIQVENLTTAFEGLNFKIKYAVKALTNISILKYIKQLGCDVDTVSLEEVHICMKAGFVPEQITYTPNSVSFAEIMQAVQLGVFVNIDNMHILTEWGKKYGNTIPCSIRINPHVMAGGNLKISTGHIDSKFGISIDYTEALLGVVHKYNINVAGIHVHTGSDISDIEVFMKVANKILEVATKFENIKIIDFGGGYKVPYKPDDKYADLAMFGANVKKAISKFGKEYGATPQVWFEPGKYLVSQCGILLVHTNVLKHAPNTTFAGIDSGLNHLIRPMMYGAHHEIVNVSNPTGNPTPVSVVGNICETDTFAWQRSIPEVRQGDYLAILNAGAYGMSMASQYNSRPRPAEVLVYHGEPYLIRKRETLEDILHNQIEVF
ncbi:MAG: diaminopimelate decarboxylase [Cytophagales bacterium]|nr:diaminopimelate decarboxylase [Cytophagales bacterium]